MTRKPAAPIGMILLLLCALSGGVWWANSSATKGEGRRDKIESEIGSDAARVVSGARRPTFLPHDALLFVRFHYENGAISLRSHERIAGKLKPQRSLRGTSGIYFRSLSSDGVPLADGIIPDPRIIHYKFSASGESPPEGGEIALDETEFVVRLPALGEDAVVVELFTVSPAESERSEFAKPGNRLGRFPLDQGE